MSIRSVLLAITIPLLLVGITGCEDLCFNWNGVSYNCLIVTQ